MPGVAVPRLPALALTSVPAVYSGIRAYPKWAAV